MSVIIPSCHTVPNAVVFQREGGATIVEVMITVIILCLGLLGVAGLQVVSLKSNQSAVARSVATSYAYEIMDYMRANPLVTSTPDGERWTKTVESVTKLCGVTQICWDRFSFVSGADPEDSGLKALKARILLDKGTLPGMEISVCRYGHANALAGTDRNGRLSCDSQRTGENKGVFFAVNVAWKQSGAGGINIAAEEEMIVTVMGEMQ